MGRAVGQGEGRRGALQRRMHILSRPFPHPPCGHPPPVGAKDGGTRLSDGAMGAVGSRSANIAIAWELDPRHESIMSTHRRNPGSEQCGFSLIEMLVTLAVLLILVSLMYGKSSATFQRRQKAACRDRLLTLHVALQLYANDHAGAFPQVSGATRPEQPLALLLPQFLSTTEPFVCPGTKRAAIPEGTALAQSSISYAYYMGQKSSSANQPLLSDAQVDGSSKPRGARLFSPDGKGPGSNHDRFGGNVLFVDGHAEESPSKSSLVLTQSDGVILLNPAR